MKLDEAMRLHAEMLAAVSGEELSAVVQLHNPKPDWGNGPVQCSGCRPDDYGADWDDCATLRVLNAWMHVDGYSTLALDGPALCTTPDNNYCPVCGLCSCRVSTSAPGVKIPVATCPLHGRCATHADGRGTKF